MRMISALFFLAVFCNEIELFYILIRFLSYRFCGCAMKIMLPVNLGWLCTSDFCSLATKVMREVFGLMVVLGVVQLLLCTKVSCFFFHVLCSSFYYNAFVFIINFSIFAVFFKLYVSYLIIFISPFSFFMKWTQKEYYLSYKMQASWTFFLLLSCLSLCLYFLFLSYFFREQNILVQGKSQSILEWSFSVFYCFIL